MKLAYKLHIIFLAVIMLLGPLADILHSVECFSHHEKSGSLSAVAVRELKGNTADDQSVAIACVNHHSPSDETSSPEHTEDTCCSSSQMDAYPLSLVNFDVSLLVSFCSSPEKLLLPQGVHSIPYTPPRFV